jgi:hypothetical protein
MTPPWCALIALSVYSLSVFVQLEIGDLPLYNQDDDGAQAP